MKKALIVLAAVAAVSALFLAASPDRLLADAPGAGITPHAGDALQQGLPKPEAQTCVVQPAQANDDYWTTSKNTPITASPLANDPDTPQQNLGGFGQPDHGTTASAGIDAITYTPDTDYVGSDSFIYTYRGCLQCFNGWCSEPDFDIGTVHITVTE